MQRTWSEVSHRIQALRDNPATAREEYERILDDEDPGLNASLSFDPSDDVARAYRRAARPHVAILREQGVNSQYEMAAAFTQHLAGDKIEALCAGSTPAETINPLMVQAMQGGA